MTTAFDPITVLSATPLRIDGDNIDTDQIFPAQFLTETTKDGFGKYAFYGWRTDASGAYIDDHFLNAAPPANRQIILADENFGCGSSREHAPWALRDYGVKIILARSLADIFRHNCVKNGVAAIELGAEAMRLLKARSGEAIDVDLDRQTIRAGDDVIPFGIDAFAKQSLLTGKDQLDMLVEARKTINAFEQRYAEG